MPRRAHRDRVIHSGGKELPLPAGRDVKDLHIEMPGGAGERMVPNDGARQKCRTKLDVGILRRQRQDRGERACHQARDPAVRDLRPLRVIKRGEQLASWYPQIVCAVHGSYKPKSSNVGSWAVLGASRFQSCRYAAHESYSGLTRRLAFVPGCCVCKSAITVWTAPVKIEIRFWHLAEQPVISEMSALTGPSRLMTFCCQVAPTCHALIVLFMSALNFGPFQPAGFSATIAASNATAAVWSRILMVCGLGGVPPLPQPVDKVKSPITRTTESTVE